jgi:SAM-dependent methyltransferase
MPEAAELERGGHGPSGGRRDAGGYAERFAIEHAHYTEDLLYWRRLARELGSPVLDLGAAVGRVALPLAADGAEVWALDADPDMLAELGRRLAEAGGAAAGRVHPVHGDLRSFALGRRFALVLMAMNTFQVLLAPEDQLACLRACREHLLPGGELAFDVALPDLGEVAGTLGLVRRTGEHEDADRGLTLLHSASYDAWDPVSQTLRFTTVIDDRDEAGAVTRHLRRHTVHLYLPSELRHLIARAGLEVLDAAGDFEGGPVEAGSQHQIYRCRAA